MADTDKKYTIRLSEEMHAELSELAEKNMRSMNKQILVIIQEAINRAKEIARKSE